MNIHYINPLSPLVLQELILHLPNLVINPLITRFHALQFVRRQRDIFPSDDTSGTRGLFLRVEKDPALACDNLGGCVERGFDVLCWDEVSSVR